MIVVSFWALVPLPAYALSPNINLFNTCNKAKQGAAAGVPDAQFAYGLMLSQGHCTFLHIKHQSEATDWWTKAASQGQADAMFLLGVAYLKGVGVSKDTSAAWQLIRNAAAQGSQEALNFLGLCQAQPRHSACN